MNQSNATSETITANDVGTLTLRDNRFTGAVFGYSDKAMRGIFTLDDESEKLDAWLNTDGQLVVKRDEVIVASGQFETTGHTNPDAPILRGSIKTTEGKTVSCAGWRTYKKSDTTKEHPFVRFSVDKPLAQNGHCFF